jgi:hypothetical protein
MAPISKAMPRPALSSWWSQQNLVVRQEQNHDWLVARESRRKARAEGTSNVITCGCDALLFPQEVKEDEELRTKQTAPDSQQRLMIQHIAPDWRNYDKRPRVRVRRVLVTCASMSDTGSDFENEVAKRRARKSGGNDVDGKEAQYKYQESEKAKAERKEKRRRYAKMYIESDKGKAARKRYRASPKGKAATKKREKKRTMRKKYLASAMRKAEQKWKAQVKKWESAKAPVKVEGVALDKDTLFKAWAYFVLDRKYNSNAE